MDDEFWKTSRQYIAFEVVDAISRYAPAWRSPYAWYVPQVKIERFIEALESVSADTDVNSVINLIATAEGIHPWQVFCISIDRRNYRHADMEEACTTMTEHKSAKKRLRSAINKNKARCRRD